MPQTVYVDSNNVVRVIDSGPPGPPGFCIHEGTGPIDLEGVALLEGGNDFSGVQTTNIELPLLTSEEIFVEDAELTVVSGIKKDGEFIIGVLGAMMDLSDIGGPPEPVGSLGTFAKDPAGNGYALEFAQAVETGGPVRTEKMVVPDLKAKHIFVDSGYPEPIGLFKTGTPRLPTDAATKGYVDDLLAPPAILRLRSAVKHGRANGGRWALCGAPGRYRTPDFGPFDREGFRWRGRARPFEPDPGQTGNKTHFWELMTQFRNADGASFDQDNMEIALMYSRSTLGLFEEDCLIETPYPVVAGEYAAGRMYVDDHYHPNSPESGLDLSIGDAVEARFDYVFNHQASGRWMKAFWIRSDAANHNPDAGDLYEIRVPSQYMDPSDRYWDDPPADLEDVYWKLVKRVIGPPGQVGSIADAGLPWYVGRNGGIGGVEFSQAFHIDSTAPNGEELVGDFQSKDIDSTTGLCSSVLVPGQVWTPYVEWDDSDETTPVLPVIDDSAMGQWRTEQRLRSLEP